MDITSLLPYEGKCPFCKSWSLIHLLGNEEITCADCGKIFTKKEAEEITGEVTVSLNAYNSLRRT